MAGYIYDIPNHLPESDKALLREAIKQSIDYSFDGLIAKAITEECRKQISDIETHKYHCAEFRSDML